MTMKDKLTIQLMAIEVLRSGIALSATFMRTREILFQAFTTSLSLSRSGVDSPTCAILLIGAVILRFCGAAPVTILFSASEIVLVMV